MSFWTSIRNALVSKPIAQVSQATSHALQQAEQHLSLAPDDWKESDDSDIKQGHAAIAALNADADKQVNQILEGLGDPVCSVTPTTPASGGQNPAQIVVPFDWKKLALVAIPAALYFLGN